MRFEFATAAQIVFGCGTFAEVPARVRGWGSHAWLVTSPSAPRASELRDQLQTAGLAVETWLVRGEPSIQGVTTAVQRAREFRADFVIGLGGGSVIDSAKAIAGLVPHPGDALDYVEVVGRGQALTHPALPWIAIPTTAGTGAEVTRNAVLSATEQRVKVSLRSPLLLARIALVDPELTRGLTPELTASTGLDALTQLIEAYVSCRANPMTDALCADAIPRIARALPVAFRQPGDLPARSDVSYASLCSGLALANAGLGAVHGFAAPIGGRFDAAHGAVCAALLASVCQANGRALAERAPASEAITRYRRVAEWLTGTREATVEDGLRWIRQLVVTFQLPRLGAYGVNAADADDLVARAQQASSTKGNPIVLTPEELKSALVAAL